MTEMLLAPWTPEQVTNISLWQTTPWVHQLTCGTDDCRTVLAVYAQGLKCPKCGYRQTWVPGVVAENGPPPDPRDQLEPPLKVRELIEGVAKQIEQQTAERVAALIVAIRLMEMHLEAITPGGVGRDTIAWAVAQSRVRALKELLAELQAGQSPQPEEPT